MTDASRGFSETTRPLSRLQAAVLGVAQRHELQKLVLLNLYKGKDLQDREAQQLLKLRFSVLRGGGVVR